MSSPRRRVLCVTHVYPRFDGDPSALFLAQWAESLRAAGHDVRVIAPHDAGLDDVGTVNGVPVRWVRYGPPDMEKLAYRGEMHKLALRPPFGPALLGAFGIEMAGAVRRAVKSWQPDVMHVHWWVPGAVVTRAARVRVPTVVHLHGTDVGVVESRPALGTVARWALQHADVVSAVSSSLAERSRKALGVTPRHINPMPLNVTQFAPSPLTDRTGRPARVLGVGRLVEEKGFADVIAALAPVGAGRGGEEPQIVLQLVGDGPDQDRLSDLAATAGVTVEFLGRKTHAELAEIYSNADVVVQPSYGEGLGMVAAEAVLANRPIVATDSGGVRDILERHLLIQPGDTNTLRARILEALDDPDMAAVQRAATRVQGLLSESASIKRTEESWTEAINRFSG